MNNNVPKRITYIDIAKCIALVLVVYSHTPGTQCQQYLGSFFIAAFFFCSGFTGGTSSTWLTHERKRVRRILVPYLFFSLLIVILSKHHSLTDFIGILYSRYCLYPLGAKSNIFFLQAGNAPLWFLTAMFVSDAVYYALVRKFDVRGRSVKFVVLLCLSVAMIAMKHLPVLLPWSLDTMPFFVLCMIAGHISKKYNLFNRPLTWYGIVALALYAALCTLNGSCNLSIREYGQSSLLCFICGKSGTIMLIAFSKLWERIILGRALAFVGTHTLTIFSLQIVIMQVVLKLIKLLGFGEFQNWGGQSGTALILIFFVFALGLLSSMVLRKCAPKIF